MNYMEYLNEFTLLKLSIGLKAMGLVWINLDRSYYTDKIYKGFKVIEDDFLHFLMNICCIFSIFIPLFNIYLIPFYLNPLYF